MCPISCVFLVIGFFSNVLAICAFMNKWYSYMKLPVYMVMVCVLHVCIMFTQTLKIFSCLLDAAVDTKGKNDPSLYPLCLYISWVSNVLAYVNSSVHVLMMHNRFKAQTTKDVTSSRLNAKRVPIAVTTTIAILSIIPASIYQTKKLAELKEIKFLRCSQLYLFPLNKESMTDVIVLMFPMIFDLITFLLLIALFVKICLKRRGRNMNSRISLAFTEDEPPFGNFSDSTDEDNPDDKVLHISPSGNLMKTQLTHQETKGRDKSMTKCVVILALGRVSISIPRHVDMALRGADHDEMRVDLLLLDDMLLMAYLASTLFIFCLGNPKFRSIILKYFTEKPKRKQVYTDITLANCTDLVKSLGGRPWSSMKSSTLWRSESESSAIKEPVPFLLEKFQESRERLRLEHVTPTSVNRQPNLDVKPKNSTSSGILRRSNRFSQGGGGGGRQLKPMDVSEAYM